MSNKKVKYKGPRVPSRFWIGMPVIFAYPVMKIKYNIHVDKKEIKNLKGPYILIATHGAAIDPAFCVCNLYPTLINFVGGYGYFKNWFLKWYFKKIGAIPKFQYQNDLNATRDMLSVLKRDGVLGIFPSGRMPSCGDGFYIPPSLTKLIKLAKVAVVSCVIHGSYLSKPKWAPNKRRGRIDIKYRVLFSSEQVINTSQEEMNDIINKELSFNDYEWNKIHHYKFAKKNLALGLESTLYRCPKCNQEYHMHTKNNSLYCDCGFELEFDRDCLFKKNNYFEDPAQYFNWQRKSINDLIKKEFEIVDNCEAIVTDIHHGLEYFGKGKVFINNNGIHFIGTIDNKETNVDFSLANMFSLPYKANSNIEIADGNFVYKFVLENGKIASKLCLIVEEMYKKNQSFVENK